MIKFDIVVVLEFLFFFSGFLLGVVTGLILGLFL